MSKGSLFSNNPGKTKNLVEFKAGKMNIDDKNWVHPDKRKGLAYIHQSSDGLTHFCWKDRTSGVVEDDLIVFPEDTEFMRIKQCTTGRVYVLKFKNSKKIFLWLQEPKTDRDDDICKKVNDSLNNLSNETSINGRDNDVQDLLTGLGAAGYSMSQNEIMTLLGIGAGSGTLGSDSEVSSRVSSAKLPAKSPKPVREVTPVAESTSNSPSKFRINELRSVLSNIKPANYQKPVSVELTDVINSISVLPLLEKRENLERLEPLLPPREGVDLLEHTRANVQSPQMQAAVKSFGSALQSGDLGPVVAQFGLGDDVNEAARSGNVKEFSKMLQATVLGVQSTKEHVDDVGTPASAEDKERSQGGEHMDQD